MRIQFLLPGFAPAPIGGYRVVYEYANELDKLGHEIAIHHAWPTSPGAGLLTRARDARWLVRGFRAPPPWFRLRPGIEIRNTLDLDRVQLGPAEVFVATSVETAEKIAAAVRRYGARGAYLVQHLETWARPASEIIESWRLPLRKIMISPWLQQIASEAGVSSDLLPNAVDVRAFPLGPPTSARNYDLATMLSPMVFKRNDIAISLFNKVHETDSTLTGIAFGVAKRPLELPSWVDYIRQPSRDQLSRLYSDTRVFFCSSDAEGWYLPGSEAMASGAALLSTDNGGVRSYADQYGTFVAVGDAAGLASAALALLNEEGETERLAAAGAEHVRSNDLAKAARRLEGLLKQDEARP